MCSAGMSAPGSRSPVDIRACSEYTLSMSTALPESVTFTDLSRNPKSVAEKAATLGRVRVTHRDGADFVLTTAEAAERHDENLSIASRLFLALMKRDSGFQSLLLGMPDLFPWVRHLGDEEIREFAVELFQALSDAAELDATETVHRAIVSWRATARIKADPDQAKDNAQPLTGLDLGPVRVHE